MFFVQSLSWSSARPLSINPRNPSLRRLITTACSFPNPNSSANSDSDDTFSGRPNNFSGVQIEETVGRDSGKLRLDSWISSRMSGISRARVQSSIRSGLVSVNGHVISKVVHPAPGNATGTLVNGILRHCRLSSVSFNPEALPEIDYDSGDEVCALPVDKGHSEESIRPGIVHRLDKGTSGLLVVAKDEHSHAHLAEQFKKHTIKRVYVSLTCGVPSPTSGRVDIPIGRDPNNRIRMIASPGSSTRGKARSAVSRYKVIEILAGGGCALVEWRLETGRTHQIRAHAKYLGIPLMGDEVYGGTKSMAISQLQSRSSSSYHRQVLQLVDRLERPCLHAFTLGFKHPHTGENLRFSQMPPTDFAETLEQLRDIGTKKVT